MQNITLRKAHQNDTSLVVDFDFRLDKVEHFKLNRAEKIQKAISKGHCFLILTDKTEVEFVIFDYRFFDQGWIELIVIDEAHRGRGIAGKAFDLLAAQCESEKFFTSTNRSNASMQAALKKAKFTFAGELQGLDDGDPELFYYRLSRS
jgi:RimJ/RimL family protein N-acetyltransferase